MTLPNASRVVTFRPEAAACFRSAQERYFLCRTGPGVPVVVSARCAHRGGPLHLGQPSADGSRIVCPMHFLATPVAALKRTAVPTIVRPDQVVAVLPGPVPSSDVVDAPPQNCAVGHGVVKQYWQ